MLIKEIMKAWNIECNPVQIYHSAWEINNSYILKAYDKEDTLQRNITIMKVLHEAGIPVPELVKLPNQQEYLLHNDKQYILTTKLRGKNIVDLKECDNQLYFEFGRSIAKLHVAFLECAEKINYWNNSMLEEMTGWVSQNLKKYEPNFVDQNEVKASIEELSSVYEDLPKQLIHRDVHLGNFFFDKGVLSGYIDFDLSQSNIRMFDICYFLLGLLLKENDQCLDKDVWFEIIPQVVKGYQSTVELRPTERRAVACVMKNIELLFVAYFLGNGDEKLAKDAANIFNFIIKNEVRIQKAVEDDFTPI